MINNPNESNKITFDKGLLSCFLIFVCATLGSYGHVLITGKYNGDFGGIYSSLDALFLMLTCVMTLLPYFILALVYSLFKFTKPQQIDLVSSNKVTFFFVILLIWSLYITIAFGVGIMAQSEHSAPSYLQLLIKIINRYNPFYLGVLFILVYNGNNKNLFFIVLMFAVLGLARAGIGVFLYIGLTLLVRNKIDLVKIIFNKPIRTIALLLLFPFFIDLLYDLRTSLRDEHVGTALSISEILFVKLMGRFSSFPNLAMIFQETEYFVSFFSQLNDNYFLMHASAGVLGTSVIPTILPERLLINIFGGDLFDKSYMVGLFGNLYLSYLNNAMFFCFNVVFCFFCVITTFIYSNKLGFKQSNEYAALLLIYPMTSGSALELSILLISVVLFYYTFKIINFIRL